MDLRKSFGSAVIFCFVLSVLPVMAQAPQDKGNRQQPPNGGTRPSPGNGNPGGGKPGGDRPGGNNGNRPAPGGGNNGGGNRPSPGGNHGGTRPGQGGGNNGGNRPGPGNGNGGRPQPSRPQPGRPTPGRPTPGRPGAGRPPVRPSRPPNWGRPPQHRPSYNFRPTDRSYLLRFYGARLAAINRAQRVHFAAGGFFPYADIQYLSPLPPDLYGQLPPPPPGYAMGYYDGYVVVYDPVSYFVANVIDLMQ